MNECFANLLFSPFKMPKCASRTEMKGKTVNTRAQPKRIALSRIIDEDDDGEEDDADDDLCWIEPRQR